MKCDKCGKEASVSLKVIFNGNSHNIHLCSDCMKKYSNMPEGLDPSKVSAENISFNPKDLEGLLQKFIPSLEEVIDGFYEYKYNQANKDLSFILNVEEKACPYCGNLQSNIRNGVFGCAYCYKLDKDLTDKVLKTYNNLSEYKGSYPRAEREFKQVADEIKILSQRLNESVETEDYELAADLKEKIDKLNMQVKN